MNTAQSTVTFNTPKCPLEQNLNDVPIGVYVTYHAYKPYQKIVVAVCYQKESSNKVGLVLSDGGNSWISNLSNYKVLYDKCSITIDIN